MVYKQSIFATAWFFLFYIYIHNQLYGVWRAESKTICGTLCALLKLSTEKFNCNIIIK